jgi:hypothetical protein
MKHLLAQNWHPGAALLGVTLAAALATPGAQAAVSVLTDPAQIAAFQAGATVETFEGLTALPITSYSAVDATGFTFSSRNAATNPTFDSGGATPSNPASNPGVPVAILTPTQGIAGDVSSPSNVAGPVGFTLDPPFFAFGQGAFMEVAMPQNMNATKIGFFVTHGTVSVNVQDDNLLALESQTVPAGSFVAFTRNSADIRNVSLTSAAGAFTIDDFTYAFTSGGGGGGGGGGNGTVPDTGSTLMLGAFSGALILLARGALRPMNRI